MKVGVNIFFKTLQKRTFTKKEERKGEQVDKTNRYILSLSGDLGYLNNQRNTKLQNMK